MPKMIFVNLPVNDLNRSVEYFTKLGFTFDPRFTDENAAAMIVSDTIVVMLVVEAFFKQFTNKPICDARQSTEVIVALSANSRAEVDAMLEKALAAGGQEHRNPQDEGWMFARSFEDLDGHLWEMVYVDKSAIPAS